MSKEFHRANKKSQLSNGDIVISRVGITGTAALVSGLNDESNCANVIIIKNDQNDGINRRYLTYALNSSFIAKQISANSAGGVQSVFNTSLAKKLRILLPPIAEQQKISEILSTVDEKIEVIEEQINQTVELQKGLMQQLLTRGIRHTHFKDSPIGEIPETWKVVRLDSVATIERGKFQHRPRNEPRFFGGKFPFIQTGDISNSSGKLTKYSQTLNDSGLSISRLFPKGTIIITIAANIGDTAIAQFDVAFPDSLIGIIAGESISNVFLRYYLVTQKAKLNALSTISAQKNINLETLRPYLIPLPPKKEQDEIATILSTVDDKLEVLNEKKAIYQQLKKALMQQLLTGKIRVYQTNSKNDATESKNLQIAVASV